MTQEPVSPKPGEILVRFTAEEGEPSGETLQPPPTDEAETQALWPFHKRSIKDIPMRVADLSSQINDIATSIQSALSTPTPTPTPGKFHVDSFEIGLAISASGNIVLVAEVGLEASITVTFKRSGG